MMVCTYGQSIKFVMVLCTALDLMKIWQKQKCPDALMQQMSILAEQVYRSITSKNRAVENVTQWCKQELCWDYVKKIRVQPVYGLGAALNGVEERKAILREAKADRKMENTIDTQKAVWELKEDYWKRLENWLRMHPLATEIEKRALKVAVKMSQGSFPDEKQCKNLMALRARAVAEGFAPK